ncbi:hypothetical protein COEREDRAFT_11630 [Coemansia reversa NRRL 1564]|uniref:Uncharacterized protein n=1 Tax=Coemansia reversa (strain ATCC 12441 / NRRL 1564) TaxID=763665 RepID=A0A2G5B3J2_COERN|nr:hypothetical protein COEREDRAFT_11630 [Coemansia reversa NRRL 1564]|eukprot:PIA13277.1 hypothetical protein COEREDRAFT_11630 [Coemansia reversa NRRL 1564]
MQAIVGILAMIVCAMAAPLTTPVNSNNTPINPAANRNLPIVNHSLAGNSNSHITPEQQLVIQNQLITQKGLESFAAQLSAQAGVPPPAGIAPFKGNRVPTKTEAQQLQIQLQAQKQIEAQVQNQAQVQAQLQAQNQALLQAQVNAQIQAQADAAARVKASSQQ